MITIEGLNDCITVTECIYLEKKLGWTVMRNSHKANKLSELKLKVRFAQVLCILLIYIYLNTYL